MFISYDIRPTKIKNNCDNVIVMGCVCINNCDNVIVMITITITISFGDCSHNNSRRRGLRGDLFLPPKLIVLL